jgi:DNA-directed RNA polymerase specialized sigma24 family protein
VRTMRERPVAVSARSRRRPPSSPLEEFERVYLRNVDVLMGYFARRCRDPQTVADLTSETFVRAVDGFAGFDPRRGSDRAWLFGIAARVFASSGRRSSSSTLRGAPRRRRRWSSASPVSRFENGCPGRGPG